jgi:hypothetical protein
LVYPRTLTFSVPGYGPSFALSPSSPCAVYNAWAAPGFRLA